MAELVHACTHTGQRRHKSGTILANETVHLPGIVDRRRGDRTAVLWPHRNCEHCLMRAGLDSNRIGGQRLLRGPGNSSTTPHQPSHSYCPYIPGLERGNTVRWFSRAPLDVPRLSATDESLVVMGCEWLLVRGNLFLDPTLLSLIFLLFFLPLFFPLVVFFSLFVFSQCYPSSSRARARTGDSTGGRRNKGINLARIRFALEAAGRALCRASRDFQVEPSPSPHDFPFFSSDRSFSFCHVDGRPIRHN